MDPTLFGNLLSDFRNSIFSLVASDGGIFQQVGMTLFSALTIIMIVFAGFRIMFSDHHSLHKLRIFTGLLLAVWIMLKLYTAPSTLLGGYAFSELIPRFAFSLADTVGIATQQTMLARLTQIQAGIDQGGAFSFLHVRDFIQYFLVAGLVAVLELAMFIVVAFGYLALAAAITIGPILIPFLLVPKLDFLFWVWLRSTIKYSFYPVIGNLVLLAICKLMLATLNATVLAGAPTVGAIAINLTQLSLILVLFLAGIFGLQNPNARERHLQRRCIRRPGRQLGCGWGCFLGSAYDKHEFTRNRTPRHSSIANAARSPGCRISGGQAPLRRAVG